jgi:hypothetical protein
MATKGFYIVDTNDGISDGVIYDREKNVVGRAWQQEAPVGNYISGKLDGYWIISDEDYKKLKQTKQ